MTAFKASYIKELLANGLESEAQSYLSQFDETALTQHWRAKVLLYKNNYQDALFLLKRLYANDQSNLLALSDICLCLYQLGFLHELKEKVMEFRARIDSSNLANLFDSVLLVSKIIEELGNLSLSQELLSFLEKQEIDSEQIQILQVQRLRLALELSDLPEVKKIFSMLNFGNSLNRSYDIEREHALLLASIELYGLEDAVHRYINLDLKKMSYSDRSFLVSELLEKIILYGQFDLLESIDFMVLKNSNSLYELTQYQLIQDFFAKKNIPILNLPNLEKKIPTLSFLRLIRQCLFLFSEVRVQSLFRERFSHGVNSLPDRRLQRVFLGSISSISKTKRILVSFERLSLADGSKIVNFKKDHLIWKVLSILKCREKITVQEFVSLFYDEQFNSQHHDRIRVMLYRLNKSLVRELLRGPIFQINKHFLWIEQHELEFR
jgi:hypothetical protein